MTRMTRPDCAVMCNLINTHTHTHTHTSLCQYVVTLAQTCMPSSRTSPSDGYSTGRRHPISPNIWRKGQKKHVFGGDSLFNLQQALSFRTRYHLCRQGVALACTRHPHPQGPASVQAHRTGEVTGSEGQEGANGVGGGIGVGGGNGDGYGDVNGHRDGDGAGTGTGWK